MKIFPLWIFLLSLFFLHCSHKNEKLATENTAERTRYQPLFDRNSAAEKHASEKDPTEKQNNPKLSAPTETPSGSTTISTVYKEYLVGKTDFAKDPGFIRVPDAYSNKTTYLRNQVYDAFLQLHTAAKAAGFDLKIVSGARSFEHQKSIWERKWKTDSRESAKEKALHILRFSSMPMSSRHHWGTDIDLNDLNNAYFESGKGLELYNWLQKHAATYGFCQVYTDKKETGRTGYEMEKWHWSYTPLSNEILKRYNQQIANTDITGFLGSETAKEIDIVRNFVNGVACK